MWRKIIAGLRFVLSLEPVAVQAIVRAVLLVITALVGVFGLQWDASELEGRLVVLIGAVWVLSELVGAVWARRQVTPSVKVVEAVPRAMTDATLLMPVIAGPANDIEEPGSVVRVIDRGATPTAL